MAQKQKEVLYDGMSAYEIDMLVEVGDADGTYSLLEDHGKYEAAEYVADTYFC